MSTLRPIASPVSYPDGDVERLRGGKAATLEQEKARLRKAAAEFESLFMYQMLKAMRQTVGESSLAKDSPMGGSLGKDTFMDMFDIEMAREISTGGSGSIADILYRTLEKKVVPEFDGPEERVQIRPLEEGDRKREAMRIQGPKMPIEGPRARPVEIAPVRRGIPLGRAVTASEPMSPAQPIAASSATRIISPVSSGSSVVPPVTAGQETATEATVKITDPIWQRFGRWIDEAAEAHQVDSTLIRAVIATESGGNPRAVSPAGAKGLMQLMDTTAADMGVKEPFDARENIMSGTKYLRRMMDRFGDLKLALAAYNAGPGAVARHGGVPPYAETEKYVEKVLDSVRTYRRGEEAPGMSKAGAGVSR